MKRILIIEDDAFLNKILRLKLAQENFEIAQAYDGEEGLKKIGETKPDLILLDLILPKVSGFEILEKIKQDPKIKNTPVIILSNLGQEDDVKRGKSLGADDYLVKANWSLEDVVKKTKRLIERE